MSRKCHDLAYDPTATSVYTFLLHKRRPDHPDGKGVIFFADTSDQTPTLVCNELSYKEGTVFPYGELSEITMQGHGNFFEEVQ